MLSVPLKEHRKVKADCRVIRIFSLFRYWHDCYFSWPIGSVRAEHVLTAHDEHLAVHEGAPISSSSHRIAIASSSYRHHIVIALSSHRHRIVIILSSNRRRIVVASSLNRHRIVAMILHLATVCPSSTLPRNCAPTCRGRCNPGAWLSPTHHGASLCPLAHPRCIVLHSPSLTHPNTSDLAEPLAHQQRYRSQMWRTYAVMESPAVLCTHVTHPAPMYPAAMYPHVTHPAPSPSRYVHAPGSHMGRQAQG